MKPLIRLKQPWERLFPSALVLVAALFPPLIGLRVYGYFGSEIFSSGPVMASFLLMGLVPFLFLTPASRYSIGLRAPSSYRWTLVFIMAGAAMAFACYYLGLLLYGKSDQHWFVSIGYGFITDERVAHMPRDWAFVAFTIPAMLASPVGEEFFFRGLLHGAVEERWSWTSALLANATLFAAVQLIHHGVYRGFDGIQFMPASGAIWFALMFGAGIVFTYARRLTGSIWGSVLAHSFFNLVTNVTIFYSLFVH